MNREYCKEKIIIGLRLIKPVYLQLIKVAETTSVESNELQAVPFIASQCSDSGKFFSALFKEDNPIVNTQARDVHCNTFILEGALDQEVIFFTEKIAETDLLRACNSSLKFWQKFSVNMPKLAHLFLILSSIPGASAHIERFFNITGLVNEKRRLRMKDDLVEMRSMLKVNMSLLSNLQESAEITEETE